MDVQQEVLSSMLISQEHEYEKRLNAWTNEGKGAWDELLRLDIDDYVLINFPKKHKLNFNNLGPYKVVKMIDKDFFVEVQSLVDSSVRFKVKANKLIRFRYDPRNSKRPEEILGEDTGSSNVLAILDHDYPGGKEVYTGAKGQRANLTFLVKFQTGEQWLPWEEVRKLEALDKYLDTGPFQRKLIHQLRTKDRKAKVTGPMFSLVWKESFDNAYMVKDDGIMLSEEDVISIDSMPMILMLECP